MLGLCSLVVQSLGVFVIDSLPDFRLVLGDERNNAAGAEISRGSFADRRLDYVDGVPGTTWQSHVDTYRVRL